MEPGSAFGSFQVLEMLGEGGMGEVYLADDPRLRRRVALKVLPQSSGTDPKKRARFLREARAAAALNHPNITTIHEIGDVEGRDYIAFEFVDGRTLDQVLEEKRFGPDEVLELGRTLAEALAYAHEQGIIHRDVKPANVMITRQGRPKLLDFGLAKINESQSKNETTTLTAGGMIVGTAGAMSPEQALGLPVDERTDVFSLGCLLYQAAAGRPAFQCESFVETIEAVIHHEPEPLGTLRPDLPRTLLGVIEKALRKEAAERYQHMSEMAADLRGKAPRRVTSVRESAAEAPGGSSSWWIYAAAVAAIGAAIWVVSTLV